MAYKRSVYKKARLELEKRRDKALGELSVRHSEAVKRCPAIVELENEMTKCGAEAVRSIGMGRDAVDFIGKLSQKSLDAQQRIKDELKKAGLPENYLEPAYTCRKCSDTGVCGEYYCECFLNQLRKSAKEEIKAKQITKCSFSNFNISYYPDRPIAPGEPNVRELMKMVLDFCKSYAESFTTGSRSITMLGKTGLGKTHLSLAIADKLIDRGFNVYYDTAQNIIDRLQQDRFSQDNSDSEVYEDIFESDLLIIDDLGTEFQTKFTVPTLYNIINTRINKSFPFILNSNMTTTELEARYSQRFTSRLLGYSDFVEFFGNDIRQIKAENG